MTHAILHVGIDVLSRKFDVALLNADGKYRSKVFPNSPQGFDLFYDWLSDHGALEAHLCMETTGAYGRDLARFLAYYKFCESVVNPALIHAFGKTELIRAKTDKADARLIARYCKTHNPAQWIPPADEVITLQTLVQRLDDLLALRNMENNRLENAELPAVPSIRKILTVIDQEIETIRRQIQDHIDDHQDLPSKKELLLSIPGIGETTVATLLAFLCPFERFASPKQMVAYAGLNPRIRQSGQWNGKASIAKTGNSQLRKALYMPALTAQRFNPVVSFFCKLLLARGKRPMQVIVAAMRKLLHIVYGVLKSGQPFCSELVLA